MAEEDRGGFWGGVGSFANNNLNPIQQFRNLQANPTAEIIKGLGNSLFPGVGSLASHLYSRNRQNSFNRGANESTALRTQRLTEAINQMPLAGILGSFSGSPGTSGPRGGLPGITSQYKPSTPTTSTPLTSYLGIPDYLQADLAPMGVGGGVGSSGANVGGSRYGGSTFGGGTQAAFASNSSGGSQWQGYGGNGGPANGREGGQLDMQFMVK